MQTTVDTSDLISWIVKGLAAVVMFLLALGAKDLKDRIKNAEDRAIAALAVANALEARIKLLERFISARED